MVVMMMMMIDSTCFLELIIIKDLFSIYFALSGWGKKISFPGSFWLPWSQTLEQKFHWIVIIGRKFYPILNWNCLPVRGALHCVLHSGIMENMSLLLDIVMFYHIPLLLAFLRAIVFNFLIILTALLCTCSNCPIQVWCQGRVNFKQVELLLPLI